MRLCTSELYFMIYHCEIIIIIIIKGEAGHGPVDPGEGEPVPDVANLQDRELFQLLEEAYSYKRPRDRQGKSEMFRVSFSLFLQGVSVRVIFCDSI